MRIPFKRRTPLDPIRTIYDAARADREHVYREGGNWIWLGPDGVARIMCPRCWNGGGGTLAPIRMKGSDEVYYLCDECDALWLVEQFDWDNYTGRLRDRSTALAERGLRGDDYEVVVDTRSPCPCCGFMTFDVESRGNWEICPVCFWEDDPVQSADPESRVGKRCLVE